MKTRKRMRLASLGLLLIALVLVFCALSHPGLGQTIYIGDFAFGAEQWRVCYGAYVLGMLGLFAGSFFVKK